jgi:molybdate transport system substrate-binding protein
VKAILLTVLVALGLVPAAAPAEAPQLRVLAAASLTEVLPRIDRRPAYSFGGSNQLAFQLRQGAPADVFASASPEFTQSLFRDGLVERPVTFASNRLVLVVPKENPAGIRSVFDLRRKDAKLVIGGARVPIGTYTREVLRRLGLSSVLSKVVSQEPDVKGIVGKVGLGQADAGFVYATDQRTASDRLVAIGIPAWAQPKVRYEIAVVARSTHKAAARAWIARLRAARAQRLLRSAGFGVR